MQERNALFRELIALGIYDSSSIRQLAKTEQEVAQEITNPATLNNYVRWIQAALNKIQSSNLQVDGIAGPKTTAAIKIFLKKNNLPYTDLKDVQLRNALTNAGAIGFIGKSPAEEDPQTESSPCEKYLQGTEREVLVRARLEPYNVKSTSSQGEVLRHVDTETVKDFSITHFDSDDANLKTNHKDLVDKLVKYMIDRSDSLNKQGITAKFVIHLQGFASLSNKDRPGHNCLLSWYRRSLTKDEFYTTHLSGRIQNLEQMGNLRYIMHDHGFFKAKVSGDDPNERKVRISIGGEDYIRPKQPPQQKPSVFKVRCLDLKDYPLPDDDEGINLFLKYFLDIDVEALLTNLLNRITSGYWAKNVDRIKDPLIKKALKAATKLMLDQLKKSISSLKIVKDLVKKWKLDKLSKTHKGVKDFFKGLKVILLFIDVGMRKGEFEIESLDFSPTQKERFLYVGMYLEVHLPKIPLIDKGISPVVESGDPWTLFRTFSINKDGTRSPYEMNVNTFQGEAYVEIGSRFVLSRPKKGFLSFSRLNKNFSYRVNNITIDEFNNKNEINFKLPKNETTLRFSPSQGVYLKE